MPGGYLNLISTGAENIILNSNPKKSFFKAVYVKHTNFGLQKFRINYLKQKELSFENETELTFKINRYADLVNDTYLCINLPDIYSSFFYDEDEQEGEKFKPYEFQWVKNIGTTLIKELEIYAGGLTITKYSGEYLHCAIQRDLNGDKRHVFEHMSGSVPELYNPAYGNGLQNTYPNSNIDTTVPVPNPEPSIRGRKIYVPIYSWFSEKSNMSLPLISLQYQEIFIKVTIRPVKELYTFLDPITGKRRSPNVNNPLHNIKNFLRQPERSDYFGTDEQGNVVAAPKNPDLSNISNSWFSDIHLISTYVFLDEPERTNFAQKPVSYLIKQVAEHEFLSESGSKRLDVFSKHCVTNYMFRFRRSDVKDRNQWTNFTNWDFENVRPQQLKPIGNGNPFGAPITNDIGEYSKNVKNILKQFAIILNGEFRENLLDSGVYMYCEKYIRTQGHFKDGIYHYSFAFTPNVQVYQPSGSMNMSKYNKITFEYNTIEPPYDLEGTGATPLCGGTNNLEVLGFREDNPGVLFKYTYDFKVFEERYNVLTLKNGTASLMYSN
tara:strand:+ start:302 stop:1951 length:1650 start_codon:yes stop_codon:yes gene_type:complete